MTDHDLRVLVAYRVDQTREAIVAARLSHESSLYCSSINRSYYAMFYAVLAFSGVRGANLRKHQAVLTMFDRDFVKPGVIEPALSTSLHRAFETRLGADYGTTSAATAEVSLQRLIDAEHFVDTLLQYIEETDTDAV